MLVAQMQQKIEEYWPLVAGGSQSLVFQPLISRHHQHTHFSSFFTHSRLLHCRSRPFSYLSLQSQSNSKDSPSYPFPAPLLTSAIFSATFYLLLFSFFIFFLICIYITFLLILTIKQPTSVPLPFFCIFTPFLLFFESEVILWVGAVQIIRRLFIGTQYKVKMFSSGGRAPACKHDIKTIMRRIDCDNHTALNSHRVEGRGNQHMGSPYKHATPGRTHSKSRQKKISANKLFSKAHQTSDNETFLTHSKSNEPYYAKQTRSNSGHCSDCLHTKRTKVLEMCQQFNIKIGGELDNNTLSLIIQKYGFYGITIDDLSSIHQNSDDSTLTSENTSLIDLIVKS